MDLYNYWLMEKAAEEEREGFAKRHKNKLVSAGSIVGGGVAGYGAGRAAEYGVRKLSDRERNYLKRDSDEALKSYKRTSAKGESLSAAAEEAKMEVGSAGRFHRYRIKNADPRLNPNTRQEAKDEIKNISSKVRQLNKAKKDHLAAMIDAEESIKRIAKAQKSFDEASGLGKAWQGGKRLVKDQFSRFLRRK